MTKEDYFKYYIQGTDHYLIPKDVFNELFNEMSNWREEAKELKKQVEEYKEQVNKGLYNTCLPYTTGYNKAIKDKENQQKEFIEWIENEIDMCDGFLDTVKSDLQEIPYGVISANKTYITTQIKENETAHKVYKEILQKYKEIIGVSDENTKD